MTPRKGFSNLGELPTTCGSGEALLRRVLLEAASRHIPRGNIPNFTPGLSPSAIAIIRERDLLRSQNPSNPLISTLESRLASTIAENNRNTWINHIESFSHSTNSSKLWSTIKHISGNSTRTPPNQPITFPQGSFSSHNDISLHFIKQFTNIIPHAQSSDTRRLRRSLTQSHPLDHNYNPFSPALVSQAIRKGGNSRAAGPDGLTILHLQHLGPFRLQFLTHLFNLSLTTVISLQVGNTQ